MVEDKDSLLVNVHSSYDGNLPDTDLSIPYDAVAENLDRLPDKNRAIVVYCGSGPMSTSAEKELASLGYANVMELDGGMRAWTAAGQTGSRVRKGRIWPGQMWCCPCKV